MTSTSSSAGGQRTQTPSLKEMMRSLESEFLLVSFCLQCLMFIRFHLNVKTTNEEETNKNRETLHNQHVWFCRVRMTGLGSVRLDSYLEGAQTQQTGRHL